MSAGVSRRHRCGGVNLTDLPQPLIAAAVPTGLVAAVRPLGAAARWCILPQGTPPPDDFATVWSAAIASDATGKISTIVTIAAMPSPVLHVALDKNIKVRSHAFLPAIA
jgi:hypothetical protein